MSNTPEVAVYVIEEPELGESEILGYARTGALLDPGSKLPRELFQLSETDKT